MTTTPNLGLPLMASNDAQKEVLYNEAIIAFDVMAARVVLDTKASPPVSPATGDTYVIAATGTTGAFVGHENKIAFYFNGWQYLTPVTKMKLYVAAKSNFYTFSGTAWVADAVSAVNVLGDLVDVVITAAANNDILQYDSATSKWKNKPQTATTTLAGMVDVNLSSVLDDQFLVYDAASSKWKNRTLHIPANTDRLLDLQDVAWESVGNHKILSWDTATSKAKWVDPVTPVPSTLAALSDVSVADAVENDALVYNGAVWGPSHLTYNYSFENMTDGPGSMDGHAGQFMVVDITESFLTFKTISELLSTSEIKLQALGDVDSGLNDGALNKVLQVYKQDGLYRFRYVALPTVATYPVKKDGENVTTAMASLNFEGFDVTSTTGNVKIKPIPLVWQAEGENVTGPPVTKINFSGTGVGVTDVGGVLEVEIAAGAEAVSEMNDVDLTIPPSGGQALVWDAAASKWKPGAAGSSGGSYDICVFFPGTMVDGNMELLRFNVVRAFTLADDFASSRASCKVNPFGTTVLTVKKNGSAIGTITLATDGSATLATSGTGTEAFTAGDVLEIIGPAVPDASLADLSITLAGSKS